MAPEGAGEDMAVDAPGAPRAAAFAAPATLCAHAGMPARLRQGVGEGAAPMLKAHAAPLWQASVYDFHSVQESMAAFDGASMVYRRFGNPNADELGKAVAALEAAEAGKEGGLEEGACGSIVVNVCYVVPELGGNEGQG